MLLVEFELILHPNEAPGVTIKHSYNSILGNLQTGVREKSLVRDSELDHWTADFCQHGRLFLVYLDLREYASRCSGAGIEYKTIHGTTPSATAFRYLNKLDYPLPSDHCSISADPAYTLTPHFTFSQSISSNFALHRISALSIHNLAYILCKKSITGCPSNGAFSAFPSP